MEWTSSETGLAAANGTVGLRNAVAVGATSVGCSTGIDAFVTCARLAIAAVGTVDTLKSVAFDFRVSVRLDWTTADWQMIFGDAFSASTARSW